MTLLEKLSKADKNNSVTKKDGSLKQRAEEALRRCNGECKFYTTYTLGSRRFTSNYTNASVVDIIKILGYKYTTGNNSPRGGKTGDFIQVSKATFNKLKGLLS